VHEVKEHRDQVLPADHSRVVEGVLQHQGWKGASENEALEARQVVRRETGLGREPAHGLITEEQDQEGKPVHDEAASTAERDGDKEQREHHPLGLDRDAAPQHHAEDEDKVRGAAGKDEARPSRQKPLARFTGFGQPRPP
jgi:hypothetical protein